MRRKLSLLLAGLVAVAGILLVPARGPRLPLPPLEREASIVIRGQDGARPRLAVAAVSERSVHGDAADLAAAVGEVLRADLAFERAFDIVEGESGADAEGEAALQPCPACPSAAEPPRELPFETWRSAGVDGLVLCAAWREGDRVHLTARLYEVATGRLAFGRELAAPASTSPGAMAHYLADQLHLAQAGLQGIARTRLAFVSDRAGSRREPTGYARKIKEIYVADYDGANQRRVTADGDLALTPSWAPDTRTLAFASYRPGFPVVFTARVDAARLATEAVGRGRSSLPAWSPDGRRIAFSSSRDGNEEIYLMNPDGTGIVRLTRHPGIDTSPAWSPDGRQIAFASGRSGSPQIWVMDADGANQRQLTREKQCDRPTWSPPPFNEIAYVSRTRTGFDIKVLDPVSGAGRQLTFGGGFNESPAWAPGGRHLAFCSTRSGSQQIWTMTREGTDLRQVTRIGNNSMPSWSR